MKRGASVWTVLIPGLAWVFAAVGLAACGSGETLSPRLSTPPPSAPVWEDTAKGWAVVHGERRFELDREPLAYRLWQGERLRVASVVAGTGGSVPNRDHDPCHDRQDGIDRCYPGFPTASLEPLVISTDPDQGAWVHAEAVLRADLDQPEGRFRLRLSDGASAILRVRFEDDGALSMRLDSAIDEVRAVSASWQAPAGEAYFGTGQRFDGIELRGRSLPLWISHGPGSARGGFSPQTPPLDQLGSAIDSGFGLTNEIAVPFFWTSRGWGLWGAQDHRGEIDFAKPESEGRVLRLMREAETLELVFYTGTPAEILAAHTARAGRPEWTPPDWAWRPMVWRDNDNTTATTRELVRGMLDRGIPLGAVWLDNPWDAGKGSFDFDPNRYEDPDALIAELAREDVKLMVWLSPFMTGSFAEDARSRGWLVEGTRPDNFDATYFPPRGLDPHLDFTHPEAVAAWIAGLERLIARGVAGAKLDRCEEDLSDDSVWFNERHNRENHNPYCTRYHAAVFEAFRRQRGDDFLAVARGGWTGSPRFTAHWDADRFSGPGVLGLRQALNGLLSTAASGFPYYGPDIGGYAGLRQDLGEAAFNNPLLTPLPGSYLRWVQLGALSPIMQTPIPPWWVNDTAIRVYRRFATLHDRLVPYIAAAADEAIDAGVPIVRPMAYAFPDDPRAVRTDDQYLFGPDLLVAPVVDLTAELALALLPSPRTVYLPAGEWIEFWSGERFVGPLTRVQLVPIDEIPIYVRAGAELPAGVSAQALP
jgi:alpha-D-xyloside xylohydrolase